MRKKLHFVFKEANNKKTASELSDYGLACNIAENKDSRVNPLLLLIISRTLGDTATTTQIPIAIPAALMCASFFGMILSDLTVKTLQKEHNLRKNQYPNIRNNDGSPAVWSDIKRMKTPKLSQPTSP